MTTQDAGSPVQRIAAVATDALAHLGELSPQLWGLSGRLWNLGAYVHRKGDIDLTHTLIAYARLKKGIITAGRIGPPTAADLDYLAGLKFLACYCEAAEPCHADVILELLANRPAHLTSANYSENSSAATDCWVTRKECLR